MPLGLKFPLRAPPLGKVVVQPMYPALDVERPVWLTTAPGDSENLYVVDQSGTIVRFPRDGNGAERTTFLSLGKRVRGEHNEEGLLGLAFAPDYDRSGVFYLFYSASNPRRSQISRFRRGADGRGDPESEEPLLAVEQPFGNHNGGTIAFGPEGHLYAGFGDGGNGGDPLDAAQDRTNLLGSIVRLAVGAEGPYEVPADNPFVGEKGVRPEIWAFGLRNPWRFSFDRQQGDLWAADVGQDNLEEIDIIVRGGNYGWRLNEGSQPFAPSKTRTDQGPLVDPVAEYGRGLGESVTGGYVYRGMAIPSLRGSYVYGDFVTGNVWALASTSPSSTPELIAAIPGLASFGEDAEGELYGLSFDRGIVRLSAPSAEEDDFPRKLSETGLFSDLHTLSASPSLQAYQPNVELWSDGAVKRRWVALPEGSHVGFSEEGPWQFPVGTVTVKHFELPLDDETPKKLRRLETRVMVHESQGWAGYTYRWNDAQTDAVLLTEPRTETITVRRAGHPVEQTWLYPAGNLCMRCHTESYGRVLGIRTRQVHRAGDDLIARWNQEGRFEYSSALREPLPAHPRLEDTSASLQDRARAYLETNCGMCHNPERASASTLNLIASVALEDARLVGEPSAAPLGLPQEMRVQPGKPESSSLWARMAIQGSLHMPPLGTSTMDDRAVELVRAWIASMPSTEP